MNKVNLQSAADSVLYSKTELLNMILDNEAKQNVLLNQSPIINVAEAIHGTYKTNFVLKKRDNIHGGLPIGKINDSPEAKKAIKAREVSKASL